MVMSSENSYLEEILQPGAQTGEDNERHRCKEDWLGSRCAVEISVFGLDLSRETREGRTVPVGREHLASIDDSQNLLCDT